MGSLRRVVSFGREERLISQGRNGTMATTGIELLLVPGFPPKLSPINGRGAVGNCYIELDRKAIPELIQALQEVLAVEERECEDPPLPAAVAEALQCSTTQLQDLANGWPHRELHEPLEQTIERNRALLSAAGEGSED